jgi:hypothetical protein
MKKITELRSKPMVQIITATNAIKASRAVKYGVTLRASEVGLGADVPPEVCED